MRLLLTRAAEDAARTREKLVALGHHVLVSPLIEIVGIEAGRPPGVVDALLATSGHAFDMAPPSLTPEARRVMPLYLVGSRTAEVARHHGFLGAAVVGSNATALAAAMGNAIHRPERILYLAGRDRKPDIEMALEVVGQHLDVVEVYEARGVESFSADAEKGLRLGTLDGVLHFSRRSAALFVTAASRLRLEAGSTVHFCLSEDVAAPLRDAGWAAIVVAEKPSEANLLALVGAP